MANRDDFTEKTKEIMAKKVGYLCSKPDCRQPTIGSKSDGSNFIKLGTAAHITAASKGGPRYEPALSSDERKHESNGIWLCPDHGRLVDVDDNHFTVETLHDWKANAEKRAFEALAYALPGSSENIEKAKNLSIPDLDNVESITTKLIEAAKTDLTVFKNSLSWPKHPVFLGLKLLDEDSSKPFEAANLVAVSGSFNEITVIAPPGTGKTTTLFQFAEGILEKNDCVAVYIPLSEWAVRQEGFLQSISNRGSFTGFTPEDLMLMAKHGRLTMVLDGWNELNENAKQKASLEIKELKRTYPDIRIILSTRQRELDIPLSKWPIVKIDNLIEKQQKEIASSLRGDEGERLLDHAWRTPGIRELISVPLYLTALLSQTAGKTLPTTKEEVLRMFVDNHEQDAEKATELKKQLLGVHREILNSLAAEATYKVTTALSESKARTVSKVALDKLIEQGQLALPIEPAAALNAFVDLHILIRPEEDGALSFQHQQFQEWYASFHVEALMLTAADGNAEDLKALRENIIDQRIWEEPILFACERLSRANESGINAVSFVILETLGIDPLLSSEIIYRSSDEVWQKVKAKVLEFAKNWHIPGHVDRAVSFMIYTGRPEFFDLLWPFISHENDQIHLRALRTGKRFRVSVLGDDIQAKLSKLNEKLRKHIISEIAHYGDIPGMELATQLAIDDSSSEVKFETISALLFRRAERYATEVLKTSPDEVWVKLAKHRYTDEISVPECQKRLNAEIKKYMEEETDPHKKINALIYLPEQSVEIAKEVETLLADADPPVSTEPHYRWTVEYEYKKYPDAVISALIKRLESDKEMPVMAEDYLLSSGVIIDEGPIIDALLSQEKPKQQVQNTRVSLVVAGTNTVGKLIERLVETSKEISQKGRPCPKDLHDKYHELMQWICQTNDEAFIQALLTRPEAKDANEISLLADLIARHGTSHNREKFEVSDDVMTQVVALIEAWGKIILAVKEADRYQLSEVARAIGRVASPQLIIVLQQLLDEDLACHQKQKKEFREALEKGQHIDNGARTFFYRSYTEALAAIGDGTAIEVIRKYLQNHDCGDDAALALRAIWKKKQPTSSETLHFRPSPDFSEVKDRRELRNTNRKNLASEQFAEDILSEVSNIVSSDPEEKERQHAFKIAKIAFTMPYGDKTELINTLFQLPGPIIEKIGILTALATAGEEISGELILEGISDIYKTAEEKKHEWMLHDSNGYRMREWMILLPFSDQPEAIVEVYEKYREKCPHTCTPRNLTDVSTALGYSPHPEAVNILKRLAEVEPAFLTEHEWVHALIKQKTLSSARAFFGLTQTQAFSINASQMNVVDMGRDLAGLISDFPKLRQEVYQKFKGAVQTPSKTVIERAIEGAPDIEGILILIRECAAQGRKMQNTPLYSAIRNLTVGERESQHWVGMSELYGVPAQELKKGIFEILTSGNEHEVLLAKECLVLFDDIRDDYGIAESETRHPDISTGIPWPLISTK